MPTPTLYERFDSRQLEVTSRGGSVARRWISVGSDDEVDVLLAATAVAGATWDGYVLEKVNPKPLGGKVFEVDALYGVGDGQGAVGVTPGTPTAPADTDNLGHGPDGTGPSIEFDISTENRKVSQSIHTLYRRRAADGAGPGVGTAPNFQQAIGVGKDKIEGCEVVIPKVTWTRTVYRDQVTMQYIRKLISVVGKVNDAPFYSTWGACECLYLGCTGRYSGDGRTWRWEMTHSFMSGVTEQNVDVGGGITVPQVRPFEYVWYTYADQVVGGRLVAVVDGAYVEQVYYPKSFSLLEIG